MKRQTRYISIIIIFLVSIIVGCGGNQYKDSRLGMTVQSLDSDLKDRWSTDGVVIVNIEPNSPAEKAGLKVGEMIAYVIGERKVNSKRECNGAIKDALKKDRTAIIKFADGRKVQIFVKKEGDKLGWELNGTKVVKVKPSSPAFLAGIKEGDQIKSVIDKKRIRTLSDYKDAINEIAGYTNKLSIQTSELVNIKLASLSALGKLGDPRAIPLLIKAMQRKDVAFRLAAAESLEHLVSLTQFDNIFKQFKENNTNKLSFDELAKMSGISKDKLIDKIQSAERLGLLNETTEQNSGSSTTNSGTKFVELVDPLGVQFKNRFQKLSKAIHSKRILELVREHFNRENEPDQEVRRYCASILAEFKSKDTIDDLIRAVKDPSEVLDIRFKAGLALSNIGQPSINVLISGLKFNDMTVKSIAATALGAIGGAKARNALIDALAYTKEAEVKLSIAEALAKIGDAESIKTLKEQKRLAQKGTGFEMFISELLNDIKGNS